MTSLEQMLLWNSLLVIPAALILRGLERLRLLQERPAFRQALWLLILLKFVTPPLLPLPILPSPQRSIAETQSPATRRAVQHPRSASSQFVAASRGNSEPARISTESILLSLSALGTLVLVGRCIRDARRISQALRRADEAPDWLYVLAANVAGPLDLPKAPRLALVDAVVSPFLWVDGNGPTIVLPRQLANGLSPEHLRCVIVHELTHYKRRDHWSNMATLAVAALCWWHPVAWWARREIHLSREACCDAQALERLRGGDRVRRCYAETLLTTLDFTNAAGPRLPVLASGFGGPSSTQGRFEMIANRSTTYQLSRWTWPILAIGCGMLLCVPVARAGEKQAPKPPEAVRKTIKVETAGGKVEDIEKIKGEDGTVWEVDIVVSGKTYELHIDPDGTLIHKQLEADDEEEEDADEQQVKSSKKKAKASKDDDSDLKPAKSKKADADEDEEEQAVSLEDLPKAVRKTLKREAAGGEVEEIERENEDGKVVYEATVEFEADDEADDEDGEDEEDDEEEDQVYEIKIAKDGTLLSKILVSEDDEDEED